ncbi:Erythromycin esterase homolog [Gracilimonas mengyeensis]|uniref:Erythromycin esterase homolog n=2 Tax=Gracilimonas mengyeensis TaxID=1302730 RepID=A0A521ESC6_9BACT|nr:Erythromycin esterase homolog [Gracilimonas mengyeensis]
MKRLLIFILALLLDGFDLAYSQHIQNLNFEKAGIVHPNQPTGWSTRWDGFELSLDSLVAKSGKYSLKSTALPGHDSGYAISRQSIPADIAAGKNLEVKLWMRSDQIQNGTAFFRLIAFDDESEVLSSTRGPEKGLPETDRWQQYSASVSIDKQAQLIYLDLFHNGKGSVWFDDIELFTEGEKYDPGNQIFWSLDPAELTFLSNQAIALHSVEPENDFSDLDHLTPLFQNASIIGLGEATHGTREFFRMKHRFVKWFAQEHDTLLVAIEANMPEVREINNYILTGKGDAKEALADLGYWVWNTEEMLAFMEWMKNYNTSGKGKIEVYGFDMAFPSRAADSVLTFLEQVDPVLFDTLQQDYQFPANPSELNRIDDENIIEIHQLTQDVYKTLSENRIKYIQYVNPETVEWAIQYARIVEQAMGRFTPGGKTRDESMAENINWIYFNKSIDRNTPLLLWAHNDHIARSPYWFGGELSEKYGKSYVPVVFSFGDGHYSAVLGPGQPVASYPAPSPKKGSVEYALRTLELPAFALNLRQIKENALGSWLEEEKPVKSIGSVARDDPYKNISLADYFDVLIYFDKTTASRSFGQPAKNN